MPHKRVIDQIPYSDGPTTLILVDVHLEAPYTMLKT